MPYNTKYAIKLKLIVLITGDTNEYSADLSSEHKCIVIWVKTLTVVLRRGFTVSGPIFRIKLHKFHRMLCMCIICHIVAHVKDFQNQCIGMVCHGNHTRLLIG